MRALPPDGIVTVPITDSVRLETGFGAAQPMAPLPLVQAAIVSSAAALIITAASMP
jgi:hypothetical protein